MKSALPRAKIWEIYFVSPFPREMSDMVKVLEDWEAAEAARGRCMVQVDLDETCRTVYSETREFYSEVAQACGNLGFKIL
jgi:hypothetical protein